MSQIIAMLHEQDTIYVRDLASRLNVTEMTIRRDLEELRVSGIIQRFHGKARLTPNDPDCLYENIENEYSLLSASTTMNIEKR